MRIFIVPAALCALAAAIFAFGSEESLVHSHKEVHEVDVDFAGYLHIPEHAFIETNIVAKFANKYDPADGKFLIGFADSGVDPNYEMLIQMSGDKYCSDHGCRTLAYHYSKKEWALIADATAQTVKTDHDGNLIYVSDGKRAVFAIPSR